MRPRLGHIHFLNCLPLYHGLVKSEAILELDLVRATPRDLTAMLLDGRLDIAPVPAIEYARHADTFAVLSDIAISSFGAVQSILLLSTKPLADLDGALVALAQTSRTSQVLTRVLLERRWGVAPRYIEMPPDWAAMLREADAALLIGDDALRAYWNPPDGVRLTDLGHEWTAWTGLPMVYAVWAVRRSYLKDYPEAVRDVEQALSASLAYCRERLDEISVHAAQLEQFPAEHFRSYFDALHFRFEAPYQTGLERYLHEARLVGELDVVPRVRFAFHKERGA